MYDVNSCQRKEMFRFLDTGLSTPLTHGSYKNALVLSHDVESL